MPYSCNLPVQGEARGCSSIPAPPSPSASSYSGFTAAQIRPAPSASARSDVLAEKSLNEQSPALHGRAPKHSISADEAPPQLSSDMVLHDTASESSARIAGLPSLLDSDVRMQGTASEGSARTAKAPSQLDSNVETQHGEHHHSSSVGCSQAEAQHESMQCERSEQEQSTVQEQQQGQHDSMQCECSAQGHSAVRKLPQCSRQDPINRVRREAGSSKLVAQRPLPTRGQARASLLVRRLFPTVQGANLSPCELC
jgi:hypothetical protein